VAYVKKIRAGLVPNASVQTFVGDPGTIFYDPTVGTLYLSDGVNPGGTALVTAGGSGDRLVNGASSFRMLSDGTLTLTHPAEPALHPLSTVLTVQKAAGNYHTISGAYGLSLQATPVPSGYGLNTNTNFVDIFHDGISVNVNNNTWEFNNSGALTFPQGTTIATADETDAFIIDGAVDKDIQIYTYSGPTPTAHGWTFGTDGNLTLPDSGTINDYVGAIGTLGILISRTFQTPVAPGGQPDYWFGTNRITLLLSDADGTKIASYLSQGIGVKVWFNQGDSYSITSIQQVQAEFGGNPYGVWNVLATGMGNRFATYESNPLIFIYTGATPNTYTNFPQYVPVGDGAGITISKGGNSWNFGADGSLTLPSGEPILFGNGNSRIQAGMGFHINSEEGISLEAVDANDPLNPITHQWHFGTDGALSFPNGALKIAGNKISNYVTTEFGASSGSQLEVALAKTVITNGVTNSLSEGGPSLTSQALFEVSTNGILSSFQVINSLGEGESALTSEYLTELDNNSFKIGQRVTNDLGDGSEPLVAFSGWTFGTGGTLSLPNSGELRPSTAAYDSALAGWEFIRGGYITATINNNLVPPGGWPMVDWYPTGATAQGYIDFLLNAWTIQNTGGATLIIQPPMSVQFYNDMRASLIAIRDSYNANTKSVSLSSAYGQSWNFGTTGSLSLPAPAPITFTATLVPVYHAGGGGDAWYYTVIFQPNTNGDGYETMISGGDTVWDHNPGYQSGDSWNFTQADHGIPGYTFTFILDDISNGPAGWTANFATGPGPEYPSTVKSTATIKLSADTKNWTFGTDGVLTFPNGGKLGNPYGDGAVNLSGNQNLYAGLASYDTKSWAGVVDATYGPGSGIPAGGGFFIQTNVNVDTKTWAFKTDGGLVFPDGTTQTTAYTGGGSTSYTPDDTDHWNEPAINTISAALDELAARVTAFENFEIDGGNAYTPALGELLIDGNGA